MIRARLSTGVAGHVFKFALVPRLAEVFYPPSRHFDPFGTELLWPGRVSHSLGISEIGLRIGDFSIRNPQFENSYKDPANFRRSSERPRASRDFTVPTLTRNVAATSS